MSAALHTIMFVDDEPWVLGALVRTLRSEPYRVLQTTDPTEALALLERERVDVIISDIDMPQITGLDLIMRVRREYPDVIRILLTGRATVDTAIRAINEGEVFRYLTKPWKDAEMRLLLREAVHRLDEIRRAAANLRASERRRKLLATLERDHPGIGVAERTEGAYVLDERRLMDMAARIASTHLSSLLK